MSSDRKYIEDETITVNAGEKVVAAGSSLVSVHGGVVDAFDNAEVHAYAGAEVCIYSPNVSVFVHGSADAVNVRKDLTVYQPGNIRIISRSAGRVEHAA